MIFKLFQQTLLRNYLFGSFVAVVIVGTTFITQTLHITQHDLDLLLIILFISLVTMVSCEWIVFQVHLQPIRQAFNDHANLNTLKNAYLRTLSFPILTFGRIMLPHFIGLAIPSSLLALLFIYLEKLSIPYSYIGFAWVGAFLIALIHGVIEFLLTTRAIKPLLEEIKKQTMTKYNIDLSLEDYVLLSIRKKFFFSILFIGIFPILLFSLATYIYLVQSYPEIINDYWQWSLTIILIVSAIAIYFSHLLTREVEVPMKQLQQGMQHVQTGKIEYLQGYYSDEFSSLIAGFNHMASSIQEKAKLNEELLESFYTVFAATLDARDPYTAGHSIRVAEFAVEIGEEIGLTIQELDLLRKSALLHDIGKIGVRDDVLLKDGKLTEEEFYQIKQHPSIGADILNRINPKNAMISLIPGVKYHHERYDGKGYPEGLSGESIPTFGRILAVADAYDAMTSDRPYRKGMDSNMALTIIEKGKGTQWDPHYAQLFIDIMNRKE
ncbi:HD domain-containing phosphohydrolase [Aquibacillus rhizosphaerae]|uniref:HD domain-containing protein n=1 Tax=Aquibacillus rhizosphaerae TaxID=3051431 RepID=A0ABT7L5A8_9BACI|nr:HD domain-containing phosphohydrolase [Aquibacillus sp. LR5S19]MDL4841044.1 HD domain-containing protein [Aquibacillus sp. LR5S19]